MKEFPVPEPILRYLSAFAVAVVVLVLGLVIVISLVRGVNLESQQLVGLLSVIGTLVALLVNLLRTQQVSTKVSQAIANQEAIDAKVTNHIDSHNAASPEAIAAVMGQQLDERGIGGPPPQAPEGT